MDSRIFLRASAHQRDIGSDSPGGKVLAKFEAVRPAALGGNRGIECFDTYFQQWAGFHEDRLKSFPSPCAPSAQHPPLPRAFPSPALRD